jgi:hypothetical protein
MIRWGVFEGNPRYLVLKYGILKEFGSPFTENDIWIGFGLGDFCTLFQHLCPKYGHLVLSKSLTLGN